MICNKTISWTILLSVWILAVLTVWQTGREYEIAQVALYEAQGERGATMIPLLPSKLCCDKKIQRIFGVLTEDQSDIIAFILKMAKNYNLDGKKFLDVAICESGLIPQQSKIWHNDKRENSWGIWQINLTAHPEITKEQAMDVEWSTEWSAKQWIAGKMYWWTCYNKKY